MTTGGEGAGMTKLSAPVSIFKTVIPLGVCSACVVVAALVLLDDHSRESLKIATWTLVVGAAVSLLIRASTFGVADSVLLDGDTLVVRVGRVEERVPLADCLGADYENPSLNHVLDTPATPRSTGWHEGRMERVRVWFRRRTRFGWTIRFIPRTGWLAVPGKSWDVADDLARRIHEARREEHERG